MIPVLYSIRERNVIIWESRFLEYKTIFGAMDTLVPQF